MPDKKISARDQYVLAWRMAREHKLADFIKTCESLGMPIPDVIDSVNFQFSRLAMNVSNEIEAHKFGQLLAPLVREQALRPLGRLWRLRRIAHYVNGKKFIPARRLSMVFASGLEFREYMWNRGWAARRK